MTEQTTVPPHAAADAAPSEEQPTGRLARLARLQALQILIVLAVIVVTFSILKTSSFLTVFNIRGIVINTAILAVLGVGMTFVIITGGIDLSVGSVLVFSAVVADKAMAGLGGQGWGAAIVGALVATGCGLVWGLVNGFLVARAKVPPLIVTLGTLGMALGLAQVITGGVDLRNVPTVMVNSVGFGNIVWQVPTLAVIAAVIVAIGIVILHRTRFGLHTYALGSNPEAGRRSGLNVNRHLIKVYALSGLLAGFPGHELVGPVDALGEGTEELRVGEYVSVNPNMNCGHCEYCRTGRTLLCANLKGLGTNWPGSFAEYVTVPASLVFSVDGIDPDISVFTEPTACAMHGVETLSPRPGSSALVFGAGPTGLLLAQLIARGGAVSVTVAASSAFKLKRAEDLGLDATFLMDRADLAGDAATLKAASGGGFDIVVDATGSAAVSEQCVPLTRSGGTVMFYGVTEPEDLVRVSPYDVFRREITIKGSFAEINSFPAAIAALRTGRARTEGLITHRFPLDDYAGALDALRSDRTVHKIIIECWQQ